MASPKVDDSVYDAALDLIATADRVDACTTEPTNVTQARTTFSVGNYTLTAGDGNGDWVVDDGAVSGRELNITTQSGNNGTGTGAANFLAYSTASTLLCVTDGDGDTINSGSAWSLTGYIVFSIPDPTDA